jgi:hypothetical protein
MQPYILLVRILKKMQDPRCIKKTRASNKTVYLITLR